MQYLQLVSALQKFTKRVDISQAEIARVLNISRSALNNRIARNFDFNDAEIDIINQFYNVDVNKYNENVNIVNIPYIKASCGNGIAIDISCINSYDINAQYSIVVAKGSSMEKTIFENDICVIKKYDGNFIDGIYCFSIGDDIFIKRLSKNINQLVCISDNPDFDKIILKGDELDAIQIYGRVVTVIRRF